MSTSTPVLGIRGMAKSYGAVQALRGVDLDVKAGELLGIIGPNGSGKSTLFDCCTGLQTPDAGTMHLDGRDITGWPMHRVAREGRFLRSFQKTVVFETMTPVESLITAGQMFAFPTLASTFSILPSSRRRTAALKARAEELIDLVGLSVVREQPAGKLSFGQQKLLQFASCLMAEPRLILLDEPLAGINPMLIERVVASIRRANELGVTFVVIEHNIDVIMGLASRIVVLDQGAILEQGAPATIVKSPKVVEAYLGG
ncbi:MAG: ABC transporter ATP-binding protein [Hyphomicrobiaceae bacterium]|nr:ABC transporter ATP-binding protein [Hyphomicrobiaceae bacterium]